jgi:hypothetical protein
MYRVRSGDGELTEQPERANDAFVDAVKHGGQALAEASPGRRGSTRHRDHVYRGRDGCSGTLTSVGTLVFE